MEGHQDDMQSVESLDRWGKLNVEMDKAAKSHMSIAGQRPRHYVMKYEPWSLWYNSHKVVKIYLRPFIVLYIPKKQGHTERIRKI